MGRVPLRIVQIVAILLVAFKFVHLSFAGVFMDEAYYWMWGQHPALSYYDHPPLNAWLLGLSSAVFGWNLFALRLPVGLSFLADIFALYLISRRIGGTNWQGHFWVTLLLFVVTPIYWMITTVALPDHLLLTACLFAIYFFFRLFQDRTSGEPGEDRDLYVGALFLGFAGLAKYNAAFLAVGLVLFIVLRDRALLRQGRLYMAAALTLAMQLPVLIWNITEHFASMEFILQGRHAGLAARFDGMYPLAIGILIFVSPFLFWPIGKFAFSAKNAIPGSGFARATFLVSTVGIVGVAFTTLVLFHWNLVAYAAMLPFLAAFMRPRWLLVLQGLYGIVFVGFAFVNYSIMPMTDVRGWGDEATAWSYGWSDVATAVEAARAAHPVSFVATADYTTASLLAFATHDRDVVSLAARTDEYDYWFDPKAHAGQDAILFGDTWRPLTPDITRQFKQITELTTVATVVHGTEYDARTIYLAQDFMPDE